MIGLDAALRRGRLLEQALKHSPANPNDAAILADFDPELDGVGRGVPSRVFGKENRFIDGATERPAPPYR